MTEATIQTPPATRVFCRNELNTRAPEKAIEFFNALCGWTTEPDKLDEFDYHWFVKDGVRFGGMIDMSSHEEWGEMHPHWLHYIAVEDCDAAVARVRELGGNICYEGTEVPGVCKFAIISDPTGGTVALYQSLKPMDIGDAFAWMELMTRDVDAAVAFYTEVIGWTTQTMPTGQGDDVYTMFANGETPIAGCFPMKGEQYEDVPVHWAGYIGTDDAQRDAAKVKELGGKIVVPPTDIPGVGRFFTFIDPTGAHISMYQSMNQG